jgi:hypothetical protein
MPAARATAQTGHDVPPLLRDAYPRHAAKMAANAAGVPIETARNWIRGRAVPSADTLLRMADTCDRMAAALERLLDARRAARMDRSRAADGRPVPAAAGSPAGGVTR